MVSAAATSSEAITLTSGRVSRWPGPAWARVRRSSAGTTPTRSTSTSTATTPSWADACWTASNATVAASARPWTRKTEMMAASSRRHRMITAHSSIAPTVTFSSWVNRLSFIVDPSRQEERGADGQQPHDEGTGQQLGHPEQPQLGQEHLAGGEQRAQHGHLGDERDHAHP